MTINFFLRKRGKEKKVYARLTHDNKSTELLLDFIYTTKAKAEPYFIKVRKELTEIYNHQIMSGSACDIQAVKQIYLTRFKNHFLMEIFRDYIDKKIKPKVDNKEMSLSGYRKYEICYNHLKDFLQCRNLDDVNIASVDAAFVDDFDAFLRQFNQHNSIIKQLTYLRCIMRYCKNVKGYIVQDPFDSVEMKRRKKFPVYLEWPDIQALMGKKYLVERLERVRDLFLFQCFTGLSYSDMAKLKQLDVQSETFTINRKKTDEPAIIYFYDVAKDILRKYNNQLPVISNVKLNAYLKELAVICGVQKRLTTHVARHTFATTVNLNNGVPIKTVQLLLGHSSVKQTEHYARLNVDSVLTTCRTNNSKLNDIYRNSVNFTVSSQDIATSVNHH